VTAPALYSAYGITLGKLEEIAGPPPTCGVIILGWPSWCIGLYLKGWDLKFVIHKNSHWAPHLSAWFPATMVVNITEVENTGLFNAVEHWFSDVEPPRKLGLWYTSAKTITSLRRLRHFPAANWSKYFSWQWHFALDQQKLFCNYSLSLFIHILGKEKDL